MGFSSEWEDRYQKNTHLSIWPWSDLVSYVMRYARPCSTDFNVLELGCGAGANIPFFLELGVNYYAVEGSSSIVRRLCERFPVCQDRIVAGDFTRDVPFDVQFDLIVDRGSITHNTTEDIRRALAIAHNLLRSGGKLVGIDWFSAEHDEFAKGPIVVDDFTRKGFTEGPFANVGNVHFSDRKHIFDIFSDFKVDVLEHKTNREEIPLQRIFATWNLVATKNSMP